MIAMWFWKSLRKILLHNKKNTAKKSLNVYEGNNKCDSRDTGNLIRNSKSVLEIQMPKSSQDVLVHFLYYKN